MCSTLQKTHAQARPVLVCWTVFVLAKSKSWEVLPYSVFGLLGTTVPSGRFNVYWQLSEGQLHVRSSCHDEFAVFDVVEGGVLRAALRDYVQRSHRSANTIGRR